MTGGPLIHDIVDVLLLKERNTQLVVLSTAALGMSSGVIGTFLVLRGRALVGDVLAHAMLPGIVLAFLVAIALGAPAVAKSLPVLLLGGATTGATGLFTTTLIRKHARLKDDAAMGIVLSVFFGIGIALLGMAQRSAEGSAAGLQSFIYGKTASMVQADLLMIGGAAIVVVVASVLLFKEFALLCFDEAFASTLGWPVRRLDWLLLALVTLVMVIGLQAVGLILMVALLIMPPAAARCWTDRLGGMAVASGAIGAMSGWLGASSSALLPRLPAGAMIVLTAASLFAISLVFGSRRGALVRMAHRLHMNRRMADQHLLRAMYELRESAAGAGGGSDVQPSALLGKRSWSAWALHRAIARARRRGLVARTARGGIELTLVGREAAGAAVRQHRLWELFLITHADVAPSHVDRSADDIEHVLGKELVAQLERALDQSGRGVVPSSPHALTTPGANV